MHQCGSNLDAGAPWTRAVAAAAFGVARIDVERQPEQFEDALNRLERVIPNLTQDPDRITAFEYSLGGQLLCHDRESACPIATHTYGHAQLPNALTRHDSPLTGDPYTYAYDTKGNQIEKRRAGVIERAASYSVADRPTVISDGGDRSTNFYYGPNRRRYLREDGDGGTMTRTYYVGNVSLVVGWSHDGKFWTGMKSAVLDGHEITYGSTGQAWDCCPAGLPALLTVTAPGGYIYMKTFRIFSILFLAFSAQSYAEQNTPPLKVIAIVARDSGSHSIWLSEPVTSENCTVTDRVVVAETTAGADFMLSLATTALVTGKDLLALVDGCIETRPGSVPVVTAPRAIKIKIFG